MGLHRIEAGIPPGEHRVPSARGEAGLPRRRHLPPERARRWRVARPRSLCRDGRGLSDRSARPLAGVVGLGRALISVRTAGYSAFPPPARPHGRASRAGNFWGTPAGLG
jgi:hypothetical protein